MMLSQLLFPFILLLWNTSSVALEDQHVINQNPKPTKTNPTDWSSFLQDSELLPCAANLFIEYGGPVGTETESQKYNIPEIEILHAKQAAFATGKVIESLELFALQTCLGDEEYCSNRANKTMSDFDKCIEGAVMNTTDISSCPSELPWVKEESQLRYREPFLSSYGLHDSCIRIPGYHYCDVMVLNQPTWIYGLCVPDVCTSEDINVGLQALLIKQGKVPVGGVGMNIDNGNSNSNLQKGQGGSGTVITNSLFSATCGDYSWPWTVGTTVMVIICFILVASIALGTFVEYAEQQGELLAKKKGHIYYKRQDIIGSIFKCFSVLTNGKLLLAPARGGPFDSFDGIRTFSMLWVVFGHTFVFQMSYLGFSNLMNIIGFDNQGWITTYPAQALTGGYFAVDTFFYMSGFLAMFMVMKEAEKMVVQKKQLRRYLLGIPFIYIQRFLRLTPTYFFVLFMYLEVLPQMSEGPFWNLLHTDIDFCHEYWWSNLLYINNVYPESQTGGCYAVTWYLANDFQFFLIVPFFGLFAVLAPKHFTATLSFIGLLIGFLLSIIFAYWDSYDNHWSINIYDPNFIGGYFIDFYVKPWYRCPPYLMGMMVAILWYYFYDPSTSPFSYTKIENNDHNNNNINNDLQAVDELSSPLLQNNNSNNNNTTSTTTATTTATSRNIKEGKAGEGKGIERTTKWREYLKNNSMYKYTLLLCSLFLFAITVLGAQGAYTNLPPDWSQTTMSFYIALSKPAWTLGLCILSFLLFAGELPFITAILANRLTAILGRLTFCAYLIHPSIIFWYYLSEGTPPHFSDIWYALTFLGLITSVFFLSILIHLAVERPVANLDRLLLGNKKKNNKKLNNNKAEEVINNGYTSAQDGPENSA